MPFNGSEGAPIDHNTAADWTKRYREKNPGQVYAHFFGREILQQMLAQSGSQGLRIYYGLDGDNQRQLLAVSAEANENDQLGKDCIVADESCGAPPYSGAPNILNS